MQECIHRWCSVTAATYHKTNIKIVSHARTIACTIYPRFWYVYIWENTLFQMGKSWNGSVNHDAILTYVNRSCLIHARIHIRSVQKRWITKRENLIFHFTLRLHVTVIRKCQKFVRFHVNVDNAKVVTCNWCCSEWRWQRIWRGKNLGFK